MYLADMEASNRSRTTRMSLDEASAPTDMAAICITEPIRASRKSRMNPRHAAEFALVGWYFVYPPANRPLEWTGFQMAPKE